MAMKVEGWKYWYARHDALQDVEGSILEIIMMRFFSSTRQARLHMLIISVLFQTCFILLPITRVERLSSYKLQVYGSVALTLHRESLVVGTVFGPSLFSDSGVFHLLLDGSDWRILPRTIRPVLFDFVSLKIF